MSSKSSESDQCSVSDDDLAFNYIPGYYFVTKSEIVEAFDSVYDTDNNHAKTSSVTSSVEPYSCEPIADKD